MAKNKWGRPLKFKSVKALQKKIDSYFDSCFEVKNFVKKEPTDIDENWEPIYVKTIEKELKMIEKPCVTWLALRLDTDRRTLINYEERALNDEDTKIDERFFHTIKRAKAKIEFYYENLTMDGSIPPHFWVFILKNNCWREDEQKHTWDVFGWILAEIWKQKDDLLWWK